MYIDVKTPRETLNKVPPNARLVLSLALKDDKYITYSIEYVKWK